MDEPAKRDIDVLRDRIGNGLSPVRSKLATALKDLFSTEDVRMAQPEISSTAEQSNTPNFLSDDDSDSEYGAVTVPAKRKRRTNNSFAVGLEDDDSSEISVPPPPKRHQFNQNGKGGSVLIGVWKDSPASDVSRKHAIYAFLDNADSLRSKIYPETRDGEILHEGYPAGTGRAFVTPDLIILDPHLSTLSRPELKEYVRLRMSHRPNELPEEREKAEALAIKEAKSVAAKLVATPTPRTAPSTPAVPTKPPKSATPNTPKGGIPNGVFLGFWKNSDAPKDFDKHAAFGVVDSNRLRVKIIKFTRDGRSYQGNFPTHPGGNWIPFDDVVREPALERLLRLEVIEYVKLRQTERVQPVFNPFGIDHDSIKQAIEAFAVLAKAQGMSAEQLNAQHESSRKAHNISRAAQKSGAVAAKGWVYESPYAQEEVRKISDPPETRGGGLKLKVVTAPREHEASGIRASLGSADSLKTDLSTPKSDLHGALAGISRTDPSDGKTKAIKSRRADADATAEKLRRAREAAKIKENAKADEESKGMASHKEVQLGRDREEVRGEVSGRATTTPQGLVQLETEMHLPTSKRGEERVENGLPARRTREAVKQDGNTIQEDNLTKRQRALAEAEARERQIDADIAKAREAAEREIAEARAKARAEKEKARMEMEMAKADAIESVSNEFFDNPDSFEEHTSAVPGENHTSGPSPDPPTSANISRGDSEVKICGDMKYVRQVKGQFVGQLVGEKRELKMIDGECYVESRVLVSVPAVKTCDGMIYAQLVRGPLEGKLVADKVEAKTIDGECYREYRVLVLIEV